ncbi:hypothetical protein [Rhodohalobacter sp. 8-1]|uniref:hypothetical protein n=1 Tax=Rhodohalobacter sp. 8-1 TaxID=3131972 RepID=UPI0030EC5D11
METTLIYELIGYAASLLVAVSLMMSNIIKLRIVNLVGSATFSLYGILIGSIPVAAMNGFIVLVNIYYLTQIYSAVEYFKILKVSSGSEYLKAFLNFYKDQIDTFQPDFNFSRLDNDLIVFVLRDMIPAGLLVGNVTKEGTLVVDLDFVVPQFRDFKIGRFLFDENRSFFSERGIHEIVATPGSQKHNDYLQEMGFRLGEGDEERYRLKL